MANMLQPCYNCSGHNDDCDICNGDGELFYIGGEEERFSLLADRWDKETSSLSNVIEKGTMDPCFAAMDKMKKKETIVWLLERMQKKPTFAMLLLKRWIKRDDSPITEDIEGKVEEMTKAWLKWGKKKKLI